MINLRGFIVLAGAVGLLLLVAGHAKARDGGQWEATDPAIRNWYRSLMQPDNPQQSCCGSADAYFADVKVRDGKTYAVISDSRDDAALGRQHIPNGTEFEVPNNKLKWDAGNPTGMAILFVGASGQVFCFVQGQQG